MIRHMVCVRYRSDVTDAQVRDIQQALAALKDRIGGFQSIEFMSNLSPEGMDHGFSEGFLITFDGVAARDAYLADSEHAKAGEKLVAAAEGGKDGIFVFDF